MAGSSTHAWGTVKPPRRMTEGARVIPTCVGNSGPAHSPIISAAGHPHMRGEQCLWPALPRFINGSSPHAWGTVAPRRLCQLRHRVIPTCVGNRIEVMSYVSQLPGHPHMRGEQKSKGCYNRRLRGSSPHAWGTVGNMCICGTISRVIPTCVGNRFLACIG